MADRLLKREPIEELAESFLTRFRAGERPPLTELVAQHPELAAEIRELFPALIELEKAGLAIRPAKNWSAMPTAFGGVALETLGDYRIIREIGRGGMGVVYEAVQQSLGRHVALKVFAPWARTDRTLIERFEREAKAAARLHHTNIVPVFGVGEHDSYRYYVMQYIEGQGLDAILGELRRLRRAPTLSTESFAGREATEAAPLATTVARSLLSGRFKGPGREPRAAGSEIDYELCDPPPTPAPASTEVSIDASSHWASQPGGSYARTVARVGLQVAEALAHAHSLGILHRDIKPSNLLLDTAGNVWVTDFGLAKADDADDLTHSGDVVGTTRYLAPERFRGESGPKSDVYSLGVTLYELLTLRPAFDERDRARLLDHILHGNRTALRAVDPTIPRDLETIVLKAMARDPADRYGSARALAEDLDRFLQDRTILARRSSPSERLRRWCKRNPVVAGLTAAVFLVMALGTTVSAWQALRAGRAAAAEKAARAAADEREAETRDVLSFVENHIIAAARPEGLQGGLGREVTLRRAIEDALPHVASAFSDKPLIEARLRLTLGSSFYFLGDPEIAHQQFEASRAIYAKFREPDHPDTLRSMANLSTSQSALGRHAEAAKLREELLAVRKATLGPRHPDTLWSMHALAVSYRATGRHAPALKLLQETLVLQKAVLGVDHRDTLATIANIAATKAVLGHQAEALTLREEILASRKAKLSSRHPDTLESMHDLGLSYQALDRHREALKVLEETLVLRKAVLGLDHRDTLATMADVGISQTVLGRHSDAVKLREELLALRKAKLGPRHPDTITSMHNVGRSYYELGNHAEAVKIFQETLPLAHGELSPHDPVTLWTMTLLANSQAALGRHPEALKLREETLALRMASQGPRHPDTLMNMHDIGMSYQALDRHAAALTLFEETLALRKSELGLDDPQTLWTMAQLAVSQHVLGRHTDALKLRKETLALRKAKLGPRDPETLLSMRDLVRSYLALDCHAEAVNLLKETLDLERGELDLHHPDTLWTMTMLAISQAALGRHPEALKLREETLALRMASQGPRHPDTLWSKHDLGKSYLAMDRPVEAFKLFEETLASRKAVLGSDHIDTIWAMDDLASSQDALGRHPEALKLREEVLSRLRANRGLDHRDTLAGQMAVAKSLIKVGRSAEAAELARQVASLWEKRKDTDPKSLYLAASYRALAATAVRAADPSADGAKQASAEADRAMAWLQKGVAAGWSDVIQMRADRNLDAIRDRADFKALTSQLK
jgi:serine/threonine protein kinase/tetratricopeptide (TPR) repeat protein